MVTVSLRPLEEQSQAVAEPGETIPAAVEGLALVDTAASRTRVDQDAGSRADLNGMDRGSISSVSHSAHSAPVFACEIEVAGLGKIRLPRVMGVTLANPRLIAIIRRDALHGTDFVYNGLTGHFSILLGGWVFRFGGISIELGLAIRIPRFRKRTRHCGPDCSRA